MSAPRKFVRCWTLKRGPIDPPEELDESTCRKIAENYVPPTKDQMDRIAAALRAESLPAEPKPEPKLMVMPRKVKPAVVQVITPEEFANARHMYPDVVEAMSRLRESGFGTGLKLKAGAMPFRKIKMLRHHANDAGFGVSVALRGTWILVEKNPLRKKRKVVRLA